jgi:SRSO17 transposase
MGCAGRVANGINTVHLSYVRERTGHALIGARQWIPAEQLSDPVAAAALGIPAGLQFRTKGQLAIDIYTDAYADGVSFDFACGDEVYGNCTPRREFFEQHQQAYVLRMASTFMLALNPQNPAQLRAGRHPARQGQAAVADPIGRPGFPRASLVRVGVDRHRLAAALPAGAPSPALR